MGKPCSLPAKKQMDERKSGASRLRSLSALSVTCPSTRMRSRKTLLGSFFALFLFCVRALRVKEEDVSSSSKRSSDLTIKSIHFHDCAEHDDVIVLERIRMDPEKITAPGKFKIDVSVNIRYVIPSQGSNARNSRTPKRNPRNITTSKILKNISVL